MYKKKFLPHALEKAHELRSKDSSPVLYVKRMSYHKEAFDPTIYLTQKEQQYLLNHDAHIVAEIIKTQAFPLPNFLKEGYHRIDNDISLN